MAYCRADKLLPKQEPGLDPDVYMHRPRTPNDQYTVLTDTQIRNIKQDRSTFFLIPIDHNKPSVYGPPREGGRYYRDRFVHLKPGANARDLNRTQNILYVDDQIRPFDIPVAHDTCRGLASAKWGPQKIGDRTRRHFFGEEVEDFTTIDMYRRPATNYTGRVVMDYGRPGDGYYTQRYPNRSSWNCSSAPLNQTNVLDSVYRKTWAEHAEVREAEQKARNARQGDWPEMSEYTRRYTVREKLFPKLSNLERQKQHAALGQQLQEQEAAEVERTRHEQAERCALAAPIPTPIVMAS